MESKSICIDTATNAPRAKRFSICLNMTYRVSGERKWHRGQVQNISSSGVLFCGKGGAPQGRTVSLVIDLSPTDGTNPRGRILAIGKIVRSFEAPGSNGVMIAAHITSARLARSTLA
jgi:hypothetical protein